MPARAIPVGYHTVTPVLTVRDAPKVLEFLKKALGAETTMQPFKRPDGKIMHTEVKIGDSRIMLAEECETAKSTLSQLYLYVANVDATHRQAVHAGGKSVMEPADMFYGDRCSAVKDPAGNTWNIATHTEDVSEVEMEKRAQAFFQKQEDKRTSASSSRN